MRNLIGMAVLAVGLLAGCAPGADEGRNDKDDGPVASSTLAPPAPSVRAEEARPKPPLSIEHALLAGPPGWAEQVQGDFVLFTSPDGFSRIAEGALMPGAAIPATL